MAKIIKNKHRPETKSKRNIVPTKRQRKVFEKVMTEGVPVVHAMKEAEYSEASQQNPQNLTQSRAWEILMEQYMSDELLAQRHHELLNKKDVTGQADTQAVAKALDMAYKIKGTYAPEKRQTLTVNVTANSEADKIAEKYEEELRKKLTS